MPSQTATLNKDTDIQTLFVYRYLLDKPDPVVNLEQDILDLRFFPERIEGSYRAEWLTYIKKQLHQLNQQSTAEQSQFWKTLETNMQAPEEDKKLSEALDIIRQSQTILAQDNVSVIKIPVKRI